MSKATALATVAAFGSGSGPVAWPSINRSALAAGLAARINDPNLISQRGTPLCGPAAFVRALAIDTPDAYAKMAIDLYTLGRATVGTNVFQPGSTLKNFPPYGNTDPADWIMLATVRDSDNMFLSPAGIFRDTFAGMTLPHTMESWLRAAGYTEIINLTYLAFKPNTIVLATELARASALFDDGYKVMLFIDSNVLDVDHQDDNVSMYPDHWVALTSDIPEVHLNQAISFTVFSWGEGRVFSLPVKYPLLKQTFLGKYYGFIAARR